MFEEGPEYWCKVPELRAKWFADTGGFNQEQVEAAVDALSKLGYDQDQKPE